MNISLTPELELFIQTKVESRMYQTASEVVREALRLMVREDQDRQAKLEALKRDVQLGLDQLDRGEYIEIRNEEEAKAFFDHIKQNGRARLAAKSKELAK
ncbi:MAG: type II toxin-antitoxin system ParD family antitoxin [Phycisphaerales bacterium]|nr:type II toxin-antitoxin system ParD family antitoxin [Phycisphaerales bacterium]